MIKSRIAKFKRLLNPFQRAIGKWVKAKGDQTYRLNYKLDENSLVFDLGGYKGDFTQSIIDRYNCRCMIFEPVPNYADEIKNRFIANPKVQVFSFAVGDGDYKTEMILHDDGSSLFNNCEGEKIIIETRDICKFIHENSIDKIDLMKINIEGGEYDLLEELISDSETISIIDNLQIQFHDIKAIRAKTRMHKIQNNLKKTHFVTWKFRPYVWENWKKK